jgi:hypothetical protein
MPIDTLSIKTSVLGVAGYLTKSLAGYGLSNRVRKFRRFYRIEARDSLSLAPIKVKLRLNLINVLDSIRISIP